MRVFWLKPNSEINVVSLRQRWRAVGIFFLVLRWVLNTFTKRTILSVVAGCLEGWSVGDTRSRGLGTFTAIVVDPPPPTINYNNNNNNAMEMRRPNVRKLERIRSRKDSAADDIIWHVIIAIIRKRQYLGYIIHYRHSIFYTIICNQFRYCNNIPRKCYIYIYI